MKELDLLNKRSRKQLEQTDESAVCMDKSLVGGVKTTLLNESFYEKF